ncbi:MAG TPA: peptide-methionine (S)-S-oxide reductase MsrA [Candidatus Baltobacteraceae bacterium]|nr:peptide-methionine (S)-S-oxide reductase MsrA [Candidatus Baltobacteraceae bacterium]
MKSILRILALGAMTLAVLGSSPRQSDRVVLAGGCFWGMQAVFEQLRGVESVVAGYSGGSASTAHYDDVSTGTTGHAESVQIVYDPSRITFEQLLDVYFLVAHDPTQLNRQGPDDGTQYRSEIYYTTAAQREAARQYIARLSRSHTYSAPIVTLVAPLAAFYPAEAYHQDYVAHHPYEPYVLINDKPKLAMLHQRFPSLLKQ